MKSTKEIADRLVALCRAGEFEKAQTELFAANALCIEQEAPPGGSRETKGLPAIVEKGRKFVASIQQMHSMAISDPIVADNSFACTMQVDVTFKGAPRAKFGEVCVYVVKDGKIASEQFFM